MTPQLISVCVRFLACSVVFICIQTTRAAPARTPPLEHQFAELRKSPPELYAFLLRMPKGADLHNHLSGAVYAETFLQDGAAGSLCVDRKTMSFAAPANSGGAHCGDDQYNASGIEGNDDLASALIDSLSMRDFVPGRESAHDHFFATFDKFGAASQGNDGEYVAEVVRRASSQNESYLELMALSGGRVGSTLGKQVGLDADFDITRRKLEAAGLGKQVEALRARIDELENGRLTKLNCNSQPDSPPCKVTVRYVMQVLRGLPKEQVFPQVLAGFMLVTADPRVVGINLVQPEDGFNSMHDYHLHMQMVDYARRLYPNVHITLHAGELASGLVPPDGLRFHIREAIQLGHAERIGHGVSIMYENDALDTLRMMHQRHIPVEVNLTSNDVILGVKGNDHPFPVYRKYGVPVTLSTDDEGVSRTHLTQEYQRAVLTYGLSYADVKYIVRNGLQYAFLRGGSLWKDGSYQSMIAPCLGGTRSAACQKFLGGNEKARLQAELEERFRLFESGLK